MIETLKYGWWDLGPEKTMDPIKEKEEQLKQRTKELEDLKKERDDNEGDRGF